MKDRLEEMRDEVGADTMTEVVRRALTMYDFVMTRKRAGSNIILRDKQGEQSIEFF